jgi:hypothetical protein
MVPGPKVGLIIGKGGETIKQLQEKSGAKMVVIQDGPTQEQEKPLRISGEPQKVEVFLICKLILISSLKRPLYQVHLASVCPVISVPCQVKIILTAWPYIA